MDTPHLRGYAGLLKQAGRTLESTIHGSSMGGTLPDGATIRIVPSRPEQYRAGQIVACVEHGLLFAHRIVDVHRDRLITQGDGWVLCDPPIQLSQVIGEVVAYRVGNEWRDPAEMAGRSGLRAWIARGHCWLIAACLRLNPALARMAAWQSMKLNARYR